MGKFQELILKPNCILDIKVTEMSRNAPHPQASQHCNRKRKEKYWRKSNGNLLVVGKKR